MIAATVVSALACAGVVYQLVTAVTAGRAAPAAAPSGVPPAVTVLKPLHGDEPRLADNLATFRHQDYPAPVQIVGGVQDADDAAIAVAGGALELVVDGTRHGRNAKISNLINMMAAAKHDVLVLSDSDMAVAPDYLRQVVAALQQPGVGAVTCFYCGRGDAGAWSRLAALGIDTGYLPSGLFATRLGLAQPCMGSTIALTRATLDRIGGFAQVADVLADDYALGEAVRGLGLRVAVAPPILVHACAEDSFAAVVAHELRWNVTIFRLQPLGFIGLALLNPLPIALLGGWWPMIVAALAARLAVALRVRRLAGGSPAPLWWLPARDLLGFALFVLTFARKSVDWRGARLGVTAAGGLTNEGQ